MMTKRDTWVLIIIVSVSVAAIALGSYVLFFAANSPGARQADNMFGDQDLKTAVALIELYKVRHGSYPARLADLDFMGDWDRIILNTVHYYPNADRSAYFVEVAQGWIGRPHVSYPPEFWQGAGFREDLRPKQETRSP
jgi:hypothetical protein